MIIENVSTLALPEIKVIRFKRFIDERGYFSETFRKEEMCNSKELDFLCGVQFLQCNESYSVAGVFRGLHFQWNPHMGKLIRCISGNLIDFALDIRPDSPNFGRIIGHELHGNVSKAYSEWIWLPPGFAHGAMLTEESVIEYFCTGTYSPDCEAAVSPLAEDIDWSYCDAYIKDEFDKLFAGPVVIKDRDRNAQTLCQWKANPNSENFIGIE